MAQTFEALNREALWDFEVRTYSSLAESGPRVLRIVGSRDLAYYHNAEITFVDVDYLALPTSFSHATFRDATEEEALALRRSAVFEGRVFCIVEEQGSADERTHFVAAMSVSVKLETVRYRHREPLLNREQPG